MSGTNLRPYGAGRRLAGGGAFDIIDAMQQEMNRVFSQFSPFGLFGQQRQQQERGGRISFIPLAEVIEDQDAYRVAIEIPGIEPQQVEVNLSGHTLTIQAERREQHQASGPQGEATATRQQEGGPQGQQAQQQRRNVLLSEIAYGQARRTFEFDQEIDSNRVQAEFRNGLLNITLPKSAQARDQQRRIEIKTS